MNKCYKCGATEELSKRGKTVMICAACRREQHRAYREGSKTEKPSKPVSMLKPVASPEWIAKAEASHRLILERRT